MSDPKSLRLAVHTLADLESTTEDQLKQAIRVLVSDKTIADEIVEPTAAKRSRKSSQHRHEVKGLCPIIRTYLEEFRPDGKPLDVIYADLVDRLAISQTKTIENIKRALEKQTNVFGYHQPSGNWRLLKWNKKPRLVA